uniref:Ig-like domain-containing protein n=1 Tax=Malurus cyaneus samueli TaxID=2593467 RepID=A0A8C5TPJ7_9PASS
IWWCWQVRNPNLWGFAGAASATVTLKEGENLELSCAFSTRGDSNSSLQWLNPRGFTIFLNDRRVLRDPRYKLLRYSEKELSIRLSNVTVHDEGIYSCFHYGRRFKNHSQKVEILAAPSVPVLEASRDAGRGIRLSCHTQGCKPQPRISWLLDNGIELPGDSRHQLGVDGKKWSSSSTLRVLRFSPKATANCTVQHPALRGHSLVASFHFQDLPRAAAAPAPGSPQYQGFYSLIIFPFNSSILFLYSFLIHSLSIPYQFLLIPMSFPYRLYFILFYWGFFLLTLKNYYFYYIFLFIFIFIFLFIYTLHQMYTAGWSGQ